MQLTCTLNIVCYFKRPFFEKHLIWPYFIITIFPLLSPLGRVVHSCPIRTKPGLKFNLCCSFWIYATSICNVYFTTSEKNLLFIHTNFLKNFQLLWERVNSGGYLGGVAWELLRVTNHTGQVEKTLLGPAGLGFEPTRPSVYYSPMLYRLSYRSSLEQVVERCIY